MGDVHLPGDVPIIGQEMRPYAIAGFALGLPFQLPQMQATFNGAMQSGAKPDVFFAMAWAHAAVHLTFHDQEIGKLADRCKLLEGAVGQLVSYVASDDVKILPPPLSLPGDHPLECLVTKQEVEGSDNGQSKAN